jgi:hypothetical protein
VSGFIVMARDATEHPLLRDGERFRAWFWMVAKACWKPSQFDVHGKIITLERGQFCCSIREMAEAWGWSKSAVDRFIQRLVDEDMVISTRAKTGTGSGTTSGTARSIITICNYAKYQDVPQQSGTAAEPQSGTAAGQQRDIKEQGNKGTRDIPNGISTARPRKIAHALPADWVPILTPAAQRVVDGWPPGRFDRVLAAFKDHAADKGRTSRDWQAAFRTWLNNDDRWNKTDDRPTRQHPQHQRASVSEIGRELAAGYAGAGGGVAQLLPRLGSAGGNG